MAGRKKPPADNDAKARGQRRQAGTKKPKEGQQRVTGKKKGNLSDKVLERKWESFQARYGAAAEIEWERLRIQTNNPRYNAVLHQTIKLKENEVEMIYGDARAALVRLREMQVKEPDQFAELVRSVRPKGATRLPKPSFKLLVARKALHERKIIEEDGLVRPGMAAVLDAAYTETREGVVLRNPIATPSREFIEELLAAEKEVDSQHRRKDQEEFEKALDDEIKKRRKRRRDDPPTR
jgi:hypothetical protein